MLSIERKFFLLRASQKSFSKVKNKFWWTSV